MDRIYNIPDLPVPANEPSYSWAATARQSSQKIMDGEYRDRLTGYYDRGDSWITTQSMIRGSNRAYVPPAFAEAVPRRQVVTWSDDGNMGSAFLPADPAVKPPVLPDLPPVAPPSGPVFGGTHPPANLDGVPAMLDQILAGINALRTKFGA